MTRKTPQEKKELKYKKERRTGALHGYVKSYPRTKARINRASRHELNAVLKSAGIESLDSAVELTDALALTRERLEHSVAHAPGAHFKAHPHTLKEWVDNRLDGRVQFAGARYFARTYDSETHRKAFSKYLQTILSGRSAKSAGVAKFYAEVLNPSSLESEKYHARRRIWLQAFFKDEPEYEHKFRVWIRELDDR